MYEVEASDNVKPPTQPDMNMRNTGDRTGYSPVKATLIGLVLILCVCNIIIYKMYKDITNVYEEAYQQNQKIYNDRYNADLMNKAIQEESTRLKEDNNQITQQNLEILKQIQEIKNINEELIKKNQQLEEDNIALQKSLKMAALSGIKPQNYTEFRGEISRSGIDREKYIGRFLGTAYTPSKEECGNNKGITNSGKPIIPGITIAIDNKHWPFGTVFYIKGLGYAVAMDTGSAIKGKYRFDFAVLDKKFARVLGSRYWDVYLVRMGKGNVEKIEF